MAKKHKLTEQEYEAYNRIHDYDHPLDEEEGKIHREKSNYARYQRKSKARL